MRIRLLASAAALAAALLLPSAAFAVTPPVITTPATTPTVTTANVLLVWGDVPDEVGYRVWRTDADCTSNPVNLTLVSDLPMNSTTYDDAPPADGTYCYYVEAVDLDTSVMPSNAVVVHYDHMPPTSTLTAPTSGPLSGIVPVHATVSDPVGGTGVNTVQFQSAPTGTSTWSTFDTGTLNGGTYDGSLDTTAITGGDGVYDFRVRATDVAGNNATSLVVAGIRVDTTGPVVNITAPTASAKVRSTISVDATAVDASGVSSITFAWSPAGAGTYTTFATETGGTSPYHETLNTTTLGGDGNYDLLVVAQDTVGNPVSSSGVRTIQVDNTAPAGTVTAPLTAANIRGTSVTSTATASDVGGSGVASVAFQSSPAGAGSWTTYDTTSTGPTWTGALNTTTLAGDGLYDLRVLVTDVAGNSAPSATIANVRVDNTVPTGAVTSPIAAAYLRGAVTVSASAADTGSGVASVVFQRSVAGAGVWTTFDTDSTGPAPYLGSLASTGLTEAGHYDLQVVVTDLAGNSATSAIVSSTTVDNTRPSTVSQPAGVTPVSAAPTITFSPATDGGSGIGHYDVYRAGRGTPINASPIPSGGPYSWSDAGAASNDPVSAGATYVYTVVAVDVAGNSSLASPGRSIIFDPQSQSAPTAVSAVATPTSLAPQISWVAPAVPGFTLDHYKVYRDGIALPNVFATTLIDSSAIQGSHTYQVVAADAGDAAFGFASSAVTVVFDATAPTAPGAPVATAALDGSISVRWGVSSDAGSGVARYIVRRALAAVAPASPADGDAVCQGLVTSCTDTTALNGKAYSYAVFAVDGAGNVSVAGTALGVTASDQTAPAAPSGLAATPGDTKVDLRWTAAGASDDVAAYVLVAKAGAAAPTSDSDGTRVCSTLVATSSACTATGLTNGATYTFGLFALDEAFNRSAAATVTAVPSGPVSDAKAPAAVKGLSVKVAGHTITLTWKNPADKDFDHVEISASERKPAAHKAAKRVYTGTGTKATTKLAPGQTRWFTVVAYDRVGNASAPATVSATVKAASPFGPAPRAKVHGPVQLRWPVVKGAKYYNVQLYAGKKRILVSWPAKHGVKLPKSKLKRGVKYTWYVWPGLGAKSKAHYGKLIGKNVFTYAG